MNEVATKPVIIMVLAMHRSGSSMITRLISNLGVNPGLDLLDARADNPEGFWENRKFHELHTKMLEASGIDWHVPSRDIDTARLLADFGEEARQIVSEMDATGGAWAWKDPRTPIFLDFWTTILRGRELRYVITNRHPASVSASLYRRNHFPDALSRCLWEFTYEQILQHVHPDDAYHIVDYDSLIADPQDHLTRLIRFIRKDISSGECQALVAQLSALIKSDLDHGSMTESPRLTRRQTYLLDILRSGRIPQDLNLEDAQPDRLRDIFSVYRDAKDRVRQEPVTAQLYFSIENEDFNESDSILIQHASGFLSFRFEEPKKISKLRFDPDSDRVAIRIKEIRFFRGSEELAIPYTKFSNASYESEGVLFFIDTDPALIMSFEGDTGHEIDRVDLQVEYIAKGQDVLKRAFDFLMQDNLRRAAHIRELKERLTMVSADSPANSDALKKTHGQALASLQAELEASIRENRRLRQEIGERDERTDECVNIKGEMQNDTPDGVVKNPLQKFLRRIRQGMKISLIKTGITKKNRSFRSYPSHMEEIKPGHSPNSI